MRQYCLGLTVPLEVIVDASNHELIDMFKKREGPLRHVKTNASPLLFPLYDALHEAFPDIVEDDVLARASGIRSNDPLLLRLNAAAFAAERVFEASSHVEQQLYDRFIPNADKDLMLQFHAVPWDQCADVVSRFSDERLRRLGQRAIYFEMPHLLSHKVRNDLDAAVRDRRTGDALMPWMTVSKALEELGSLAEIEHGGTVDDYASMLTLLAPA